jgi:hypothetical protein
MHMSLVATNCLLAEGRWHCLIRYCSFSCSRQDEVTKHARHWHDSLVSAQVHELQSGRLVQHVARGMHCCCHAVHSQLQHRLLCWSVLVSSCATAAHSGDCTLFWASRVAQDLSSLRSNRSSGRLLLRSPELHSPTDDDTMQCCQLGLYNTLAVKQGGAAGVFQADVCL